MRNSSAIENSYYDGAIQHLLKELSILVSLRKERVPSPTSDFIAEVDDARDGYFYQKLSYIIRASRALTRLVVNLVKNVT